MLVRNLGHSLLFKYHLDIVFHHASHFCMILCFLLFLVIPNIKDKYQTQQPSLRTKIFEPISSPNHTIPYIELYPSINIAIVDGFLSYESIMLTYECGQSQSILEDVHYTLTIDDNLSKNVVFLCYQSESQFIKFINLYHRVAFPSPQLQKLGIIRASLNLDLVTEGTKLFFKRYNNNGLHPDLDYFLSIKELLESLSISWMPCQAIYRNQIYSWIRKSIKSQQFHKELMCQFDELIRKQQSVHGVQLEQGIQSSTLSTHALSGQPIKSQKLSKLVLSFVKQFSLFQDHLHSASTLYYPLNEYYSISVKGFILPPLIFLLFAVAYVVNMYCRSKIQLVEIPINFPILISVIAASWQYYIFNSLRYTFMIGIIVRLVVFMYYYRISQSQRKFYKIILCAFNGVLLYHYAFYMTPLAYVGMISTSLIGLISVRKCCFLGIVVIGWINMSILEMSNSVGLLLYPFSIYMTMI